MNEIVLELAKEGKFWKYYPEQVKGLVYRSCAYENKLIKTPAECVCSDCKKRSIKRSHTISKSMSLELIQEDREVYVPTFIRKYASGKDFICIEKIGINEASAFSGFCKEHEMLFSDFEVDGIFDAEKHICKQTYRNLCRNISLKKANYRALNNLIKEYKICDLKYTVPVAVCGITEIKIENINYMIAIDVIPLDKRTILSISCEDEMPIELKECLQEQINLPIDFINLIESIMIYGTDQWFVKPSVWNKIEDNRKKAILREMMVIDIPFFQEVKFSIFDDIRKFLIKGMKENNVSEEIIKKETAKLKYSECIDFSFLLTKIQNLYENTLL